MKKKEAGGEIFLITTVVPLWLGLAALCFGKEPQDYSLTERRLLAQPPRATVKNLAEGSFMQDFEAYSQDQFPFREGLRQLKAAVSMKVLGKKDNHGIYYTQGQLSKLDYPLQKAQADYAAQKINGIYTTYLEGKEINCYLALIPDKNFYLAEGNGYPAMDYDGLYRYMEEQLAQMKMIDLRELLEAEDFYTTDTHWRQERLLPIADSLAGAMGKERRAEYALRKTRVPFYGVYVGQSGLRIEPDRICYLTNEILQDCVVTSYDTGVPVVKTIYDEKKLLGKDPYEFFLSGSQALMTIENPRARGEGELIVFRDSFGSSIIPLLAECYEKITLVDIRYINSSLLGEFIHFDRQDVLFLYSTLLLNSSMGMK